MDYLLILGFVILCLGMTLKYTNPVKYNEIKQNILNWTKE
tara:strand:- start:2200 stop:2319 length:120 start_codon:yes stop_codon:yes gene_type:complete